MYTNNVLVTRTDYRSREKQTGAMSWGQSTGGGFSAVPLRRTQQEGKGNIGQLSLEKITLRGDLLKLTQRKGRWESEKIVKQTDERRDADQVLTPREAVFYRRPRTCSRVSLWSHSSGRRWAFCSCYKRKLHMS